MKNTFIYTLCIVWMGFAFPSFAQTDLEFWFAAPEITTSHGDRPVLLRCTALSTPAEVTVDQPANSSFPVQRFTIPANSSYSLDITTWIEQIENKPANTVLNYGIHITATALITAYYEVANGFNNEIFALKGRNGLGTAFMIPSQNIMNNGNYPIPANSSFDIVATENNTTVTITPSTNLIGHSAGQTYTLLLQKGQTYSATAASTTVAAHLMGSEVTANQPIAITVKDDSMTGGGYGGCLDMGGDQLVPMTMIGKNYISIPGYLTIPTGVPTDQVFILANQANTQVTINNIVEATLQKGETYRRPSNNEVLYIQTSQPTYVYHLSGFGCEVGQALLPQIICTGSNTVGFTRATSEPLYMNILVPTGGENAFTFNGNSSTILPSSFVDVPFTAGQWKYTRILVANNQLSQGNAAIVENPLMSFHLSIIHGDSLTGCRYGYFSGFTTLSAKAFNNIPPGNALCIGDTLRLNCDVNGLQGIQFEWFGPNGFTSTLQNPFIINGNVQHAGKYRCIATKTACKKDTVFTDIAVSDFPISKASSNSPICFSQNLLLTAANAGLGVSYRWSGSNGFTANQQTGSLKNAQSGWYTLVTNKMGCLAKDSVLVNIDKSPGAYPTQTGPYCSSNTILLEAGIPPHGVGHNATFHWSGPNGFKAEGNKVSIPSATVAASGNYMLTVNSPACGDSVASIAVLVNPTPQVQFDPIPFICQEISPYYITQAKETTGLPGVGIFSGKGITSTGLFAPSVAGQGSHLITYRFDANNGCSTSINQLMVVHRSPMVEAIADRILLAGNGILLQPTVSGNLAKIEWLPNTQLSNNTILQPFASPDLTTTYALTVTTTDNCTSRDSIQIKVISGIGIPSAFSPNGDGINDVWHLDGLIGFPDARLQVFNRFGQLIFSTKGATQHWDGNYKNKPLPVGTYYYTLLLNATYSTKPLQGSVTIVR